MTRKVLQQYLYMSEDHYVIMKNSLGVPLEIRMHDDLHYYSRNTHFPDVPEMRVSSGMAVVTLLEIIQQLKDSPAVEFPNSFGDRWSETQAICSMNVAQNKMKRMDQVGRRT